MCVVTYKQYDTEQEINFALDIIRFARLYKPGDGIIGRMSKIRFREYRIQHVVIAFDNDRAIGCMTVDLKTAQKSWSTYDASLPSEYSRVNVWVKPQYRRKGIGKNLLSMTGVSSEIGVECYDTGRAARKLYANLTSARMY